MYDYNVEYLEVQMKHATLESSLQLEPFEHYLATIRFSNFNFSWAGNVGNMLTSLYFSWFSPHGLMTTTAETAYYFNDWA